MQVVTLQMRHWMVPVNYWCTTFALEARECVHAMVLSSVVQWWEDSQLRILVLGSLAIQCYLALFASARKKHVQPLFRFTIWLAYLGGDALAIYALAILFNRQRKLQNSSIDGSHGLEVLWAPILLWHLGGQTNISAYNIEDNELWSRHVLTTVSQVTVAIYVFCKSWSSSADKRLLAACILLFILGVLKCFEKPFALKRASFNGIASTFRPTPRTENTKREVELEEYIQEARIVLVLAIISRVRMQLNQDPRRLLSDEQEKRVKELSMPDKLFVDYAYVYNERLARMKSFWLLDKGSTYEALSQGLSNTFNLIYSKLFQWGDYNRTTPSCSNLCSFFNMYFFYPLLPIVPIALFHASRKQAYRGSDIKVTFSLLYITYFLEILSCLTNAWFRKKWSNGVAQHSLIGFLAWNRRHTRLMSIIEFFQCKGLLDTYFSFKPCHSSKDITMLVHEHANAGWESHITNIESYWRFTDSRGQWALEGSGSEEILGWSIEKPFDESIVLWHVATDFCFYSNGTSGYSRRAGMCRQISNYMMHLLFANPGMLLPGSRRNLFTDAYDELEAILRGDDVSLLDEKEVTQRVIGKAESAKGYIRDSWVLAQQLMQLTDEKMWETIKGVWVEMLCFSAGRCRGYLHAKSLGSGGEYLSYVSLLMSHAGLETYAERQQRVQLRLSKEERVKIANQRIVEAVSNQATGGSSTPQGMAPVKDEEIATAPLASQVGQLEKEEDAASTSASRVESVAPAPAIKIVVSP